MSSFFIDLLLIAICIFTVILGTKRGFVKTLLSFLSTIVALVCSYTFTPIFATFLKEKFFLAPIADSIADTIRSIIPTTNGSYNFELLFDDMPQTLSAILERYNVDPDSLREATSAMPEQGEEAVSVLSEMIALPIVDMITTVVAFVTIFVVLVVVLTIISVVLNSVFKLPVLKSANTFLGFILGLATAIVILFVYSSLVSTLVISLGSISPKWFGSDVIDQTLIVKFFSEHDFLSIVNNLLS